MSYTHDLEYYGGNANNQSYLESLAAAKVAARVSPAAQLKAIDSPALTDNQAAVVSAAELAAKLVPVPPAAAPTWKAKS